MSRLYLGIDCATPFLSLALWDDVRGQVAAFQEEVGRDHAARIVGELAELFRRGSAAPSAVHAIGVGVGPGSYTGVRVALATAAGLGRAWNVTVAGVPTLAAMAAGALRPGESAAVALDARRGNVYAAVYRRPEPATILEAMRLEELRAVAKLPREGLATRLGARRVIEDAAPSAAYTAAAARELRPAVAVYL